MLNIFKNSWKGIFKGCFYFILFLLLLRQSFSYLDPDFGWHLLSGQEFTITHRPPQINQGNYTLFGQSWIDHEWLANLFIYQVYNNYSYFFLNIFFVLLILVVVLVLNWYIARFFLSEQNRKNAALWLVIYIFEFLTVVAMAPSFGVRVQEFSVLFLLLFLIILDIYRRRKKEKILFFLIPLLVLWANIHGGFLIIYPLFLLFLGSYSFLLMFQTHKKRLYFLNFDNLLTRVQIIKVAAIFVIASLATLLTPYGLDLYEGFGDYRNSFYLTHIQEWLPQFYYPFCYNQIIYLSVAIIFFSFSIYHFKNKQDKLDLWSFFLLVFLFILAIKSRRHFPLFAVASFPYLFSFFISFLELPNIIEGFKVWFSKGQRKFIGCCLAVSAIFLGGTYFVQINFTNQPFQYFCQNKGGLKYPCGAVMFLKDHQEYNQKKLLNYFGWGGYLLWEYPERQIFIDGRLPHYAYQGRSILEEYYDFFVSWEKAEEKLNQHEIGLVLLPKDDGKAILNNYESKFLMIHPEEVETKNYLREYLDSSRSWKKVFTDEAAVIYARQ